VSNKESNDKKIRICPFSVRESRQSLVRPCHRGIFWEKLGGGGGTLMEQSKVSSPEMGRKIKERS
jgi:hypothetical protein